MDIIEEAIAVRRKLHSHPEEGWTEFETAFLVSQKLESLGWEIFLGTQALVPEKVLGRDETKVEKAMLRAREAGVPESFLDNTEGYTGVVGFFDTGRPGPRTVLRFDMDCVQVEESQSADHVPTRMGFCSTRPGLMHACGHDAHTAIGLATAHWISENQDKLCGSFRLIFQPAEEGTRGAAPMAAKGWVDDADYFFASHCGMYCRSGEIGLGVSGFFATSKLDITFTGTPSHAGAFPEKGRSALSAACAAVMMIQGISRNSQGKTNISIGRLEAGEGRNVTPAHAKILMETRGETDVVNEFLVDQVRHIVSGAAQAYGVESEIKLVGQATTLKTTSKGIEILKAAAKQTPGVKDIQEYEHIGGSEDVSLLFKRALEHGADGAFFMWGCDNDGHHRQDFDVQDEKNMPVAIQMYQKILKRTNGSLEDGSR